MVVEDTTREITMDVGTTEITPAGDTISMINTTSMMITPVVVVVGVVVVTTTTMMMTTVVTIVTTGDEEGVTTRATRVVVAVATMMMGITGGVAGVVVIMVMEEGGGTMVEVGEEITMVVEVDVVIIEEVVGTTAEVVEGTMMMAMDTEVGVVAEEGVATTEVVEATTMVGVVAEEAHEVDEAEVVVVTVTTMTEVVVTTMTTTTREGVAVVAIRGATTTDKTMGVTTGRTAAMEEGVVAMTVPTRRGESIVAAGGMTTRARVVTKGKAPALTTRTTRMTTTVVETTPTTTRSSTANGMMSTTTMATMTGTGLHISPPVRSLTTIVIAITAPPIKSLSPPGPVPGPWTVVTAPAPVRVAAVAEAPVTAVFLPSHVPSIRNVASSGRVTTGALLIPHLHRLQRVITLPVTIPTSPAPIETTMNQWILTKVAVVVAVALTACTSILPRDIAWITTRPNTPPPGTTAAARARGRQLTPLLAATCMR